MTISMLSRRLFRKYSEYLLSRPPNRRRNDRRSTLRIECLEDRTTPAPLTTANDNWHFFADNDASSSLTIGDSVRNDNDTIAPGTITATYGVDGFGTVTTGAFTGSLPLSDSINSAIIAADVGGMVNVLEGTYGELVVVNKTVTVSGAQAGVDARTDRPGAAESIIQGNVSGQGGFILSANDITLDGFTVQNITNAFPGSGLTLGATTSGAQVLNNIIQDNILGINLANTGATQARIQFNLIQNNNQPGAASGHGIYTDHFVAGVTLSNVLIDSNRFVGHTGQGIGFSSTAALTPSTAITISNNVFDGNGRGLYAFNLTSSSITGNTFQNSTDAATADLRLFEGVSALTISNNVLQNGAGRAVRISNAGTGSPNATNVSFTFNSVTGYTGPAGTFQVDTAGYTGTLNATGNWWGNITGPTTTTNPGGTGQSIDDPDGVVDFQPWLIYASDSNPVVAGVQLPTDITVAAQTADFTATNNNYRLLVNVVDLLQDDQTVTLSGTFDWTEANAAASWALGNDGVASADDFSLIVRPNLHGVTFTAASLGSARIQGPGDLAAANLEGFLLFDGGDNQNWTISNLEIFDLDAGLGFFNGAGGIDAFNDLEILNNHIRIPADLNSVVAPIDVSQNIGIHFSFGENQTIQGNQIDMAGNGVSDGVNFSTTVGMQSNTAAGDAYDGLLIDGNILRVLDAQSANPSAILGIWENGHVHTNNLTISNNQFLNLAAGNDPALNLQRAFRVTSHSSVTSTVTYSRNTVQGANIGFQWLAGSNFAAHEPVQLIENSITSRKAAPLCSTTICPATQVSRSTI